MDEEEIGLALRILDDQMVDADGERFGRVDDVELEGEVGADARVAALIVGAGAWRWRVPHRLAGAVAALTPKVVRRVPWELVREVDPGAVHVSVPARELGFGTAEGAAARWVGELGRETLRLSSLLDAKVTSDGGRALGRIWEVHALKEQTGQLRITGVGVGRTGLRQRVAGPRAPGTAVEWSRLARSHDGSLVMRGSDPAARAHQP
jgi:sporulation protein YlmC with PRC-barrel domain